MISGIQGNLNISSDTMLQMREKMFAEIDQDGDGQISQTEMDSFASQMAERTGKAENSEDMFLKADTDGDGALSKDEFAAMRPPEPKGMKPSDEEMQQRQAEMFAEIDENGDGQIDKAEMEAFEAKMAEQTGQSGMAEEIFMQGDTNGDGYLSEEEFSALKPPEPPDFKDGYMYQADLQTTTAAELTGSLMDIMG